MRYPFRLVTAGDATLIVEFADRIDPAINGAAIAVAHAIRAACVSGVRDVASTYRSVAVHFDPLHTEHSALVKTIERAASMTEGTGLSIGDGSPYPYGDPSPIRVPVCYAGEFGPDLAAVAAFGGLTEAETLRMHTARTYRVFMLGFSPGFTYMGSVDSRIAAPRRAAPRAMVPAGSVGIAGVQTGIYPAQTPGGWQIVGRTPVKPFDLTREKPFLFKPGDAVQFYAIEPSEYTRLQSRR